MFKMHFTREAVEQATEQMLTDRGEQFIYARPDERLYKSGAAQCLYEHENDNGESVPGCAVGYIVNAITGHVPGEWDDPKDGGGLGHLSLSGVVTFDTEWTKNFLRRLQFCQDQGWTLAEAVEAARQATA